MGIAAEQYEDDGLQSASITFRIQEYHAASTQNRARMLDAVGIFDELGLAEAHGLSSTSQWLQRELRIATSLAYEYARVARGLRRFRVLYAAFAAGEIAYSTVRYLLPRMTEDNEVELVELAKCLCDSELRQALAGVGNEESVDPAEPFFKANVLDNGMLDVRALLPAVAGQEVLSALKIAQLASYGIEDLDTDALLDPEAVEKLINEVEHQEEACPGEQVRAPDKDTSLSADKVLNLPSRYGPPEKGDMYAAFLTMVQMVRSNPLSPLRTPGAQVNIMVTEDGRCWMPENPSARSEEIRSYVANAVARMHYLDRKGLTLNVGRAQRFATDGQVQALIAVWGYQCAMPGCAHRRFLQVHHIKAWEHGGATNLDNLIPLCSSCHSNVSHGIAHIESAGPNLYFRFQDGSQFVSRNRMLPRKTANFKGSMVTNPRVAGTSFDV